MNKLLWVCSGSGSPQVEWIYSFLPHYEPDNLSDCREEGATPPTAKGDFFFFLQTTVTVNWQQSQHVNKLWTVAFGCRMCAML